MIGEGETETGETTSSGRVEHVEVDVEFAHALDDGAGLAIQLKTPASIVFTTLDFYYALPSAGETYYGFGAEIGALPGVYGVVTQYFGDALFVTFTPRVLFAESRAENALLINPQLAFGIDGGVDLMGFASFAYHTGRGFDFDIDIFGEDDRHDYHKKYWLVGLASRF